MRHAFVYFDCTISVLSIAFQCIALQGVVNAKFRLVGYRRFLLSLLASDMLLCFVRLLWSIGLQSFIGGSAADEEQMYMLTNASAFHNCSTCVLRLFLALGLSTNLFNLCGMSVDLYIALVRPMQYTHIMNKPLARKAVIVFWVLSFFLASCNIPIAGISYLRNNQGPRKATTQPSPAAGSMTNSFFNNSLLHSFNCNATNSSSLSSSSSSSWVMPNNTTTVESKKMSKRLYRSDNGKRATRHSRRQIRSTKRTPTMSEKELPNDEIKKLLLESVDLLLITDVQYEEVLKNRLASEICCRNVAFCVALSNQLDDLTEDPELMTLAGIEPQPLHLWCKRFNAAQIWTEFFLVVSVILAFPFLAVFYGKACSHVTTSGSLRGGMSGGGRESNIRKLGATTLLVLAIFACCWLPQMTYEIYMFVATQLSKDSSGFSDRYISVHNVFSSALLLSPLFHPIIYVVRVAPVQKALLHKYRCLVPSLKPGRSQSTIRALVVRTARTFSTSKTQSIHTSVSLHNTTYHDVDI